MSRLLLILILATGWRTSPAAPALTMISDRLLAPVLQTWSKRLPIESELQVSNTLTAIQDLIHGRADLIAVGRPFSREELLQIRQLSHQGTIVSLPVGIDAVAVYVPLRSPLKTLSLAQLAHLFGVPSCRLSRTGAPAAMPSIRYGLGPAAAGHYHFVRQVLCNGPLLPQVTLLDSDLDLVKTVVKNPRAIGFASATMTSIPGVRPLALKSGPKARSYLPTRQYIRSGRYPLTHFLYLHLRSTHDGAKSLARLALTPRGQMLLDRYFVALPKPMRVRAMQALLR